LVLICCYCFTDIGTPLSRNQPPKFPQTLTSPTATSKPTPSTISSEPRQKLSFTIKTPTKISKAQFSEQKPSQENQTKVELPHNNENINYEQKTVTENNSKVEKVQKNSSTANEAEESKKKSNDIKKDSAVESSSASNRTTSPKDEKPPEPIRVSFPVKKDEKRESPTKNVRPPHLFIPRSVHTKTTTNETKSTGKIKVIAESILKYS